MSSKLIFDFLEDFLVSTYFHKNKTTYRKRRPHWIPFSSRRTQPEIPRSFKSLIHDASSRKPLLININPRQQLLRLVQIFFNLLNPLISPSPPLINVIFQKASDLLARVVLYDPRKKVLLRDSSGLAVVAVALHSKGAFRVKHAVNLPDNFPLTNYGDLFLSNRILHPRFFWYRPAPWTRLVRIRRRYR